MARDTAQAIIEEDPECQSDKYGILWKRLRELRKTNINWGVIS
jgi:ATP-dependent DNA helicase RecG